MAALKALTRTPDDGRVLERAHGLVAHAGLTVPPFSAEVVAEPPADESRVRALRQAIEVLLVPVDEPDGLLASGRLALAEWGSALVSRAETRGLPVFPYAAPDPFGRPPDPLMWETFDPGGCLP
jgi:hypothetical protein